MAPVAYELCLVGASVDGEDGAGASEQIEILNRVIRQYGGSTIGPWEFQFDAFESAKDAASDLRKNGFVFDRAEILTVDAITG